MFLFGAVCGCVITGFFARYKPEFFASAASLVELQIKAAKVVADKQLAAKNPPADTGS
jgi:hypothetical protein